MVDRLSLIDSAFTASGETPDTNDTCYNYACILCHYGALVMEFRDAWAKGDTVLLQANASLSPNLAHQVMWHRFVNTKGGMGKNIPCDLYNEHVTHAHSTKSDTQDVKKVVRVVMLLTPTAGRQHSAFQLHLDPLHKWDIQKTKMWIERKKKNIYKRKLSCRRRTK